MMCCCCREGNEQDGPALRGGATARSGVEDHPPAHVVGLASFEDDLIPPAEVDQMTNSMLFLV